MNFLVFIIYFGIVSGIDDFNNSVLPFKPWGTQCTKSKNIVCGEDDWEDCSRNETNLEINVAVMLPEQDYFVVNLNEAVEILKAAVNISKERNIIDETVTVTFTRYDDQCIQEKATVGLIKSTSKSCPDHGPDVIFGPLCDLCLASVARVTKFLGNVGIPVFTPGGLTFDFTNKKQDCDDEFYSIVNIGPADFRSYAEFFHLILERYRWRNVALMYDKYQQTEVGGARSCQLLMETLLEDIKFSAKVDYIDGDLVLTKLSFAEFLKTKVGTNYGIVVICTSHQNLIEFILEAQKLNFLDQGEYTFFNFQLYNNATILSEPWVHSEDSERNNLAKTALQSVYTFLPWEESQFNNNKNLTMANRRGSIFRDSLADGMLLYLEVFARALNENQNITGGLILQNIKGFQFQGMNENITMNCNAQKITKYAMLNVNSEGKYEVVAEYTTLNKTITFWNVKWPFGKPPSDVPKCGYDMSKCPPYDSNNTILISLILAVCLVLLVAAYILYRQIKLKRDIYSRAWKVNYNDIMFFPQKSRSSFQSTISIRTEVDGFSMAGDRQLFATVGYHKSIRVAVKRLQDVKLDLRHKELVELKVMKDLSHDNLVKFYGACLDIPNCILTEYCPKGSLQDILENDEVKLDFPFRMSLIMDLVRGMCYLHNSPIKSHGALKSPNCLVDSRFVLKIADFGLHFLRIHSCEDVTDKEDRAYWQRKLWTAPELLRNEIEGGTQEGDVYSFGIIMHEVITRQGVFFLGQDLYMEPKEIVDALQKGPDANSKALRPVIGDAICEDEVARIMNKCWAEDTGDRPDFSTLKKTLHQINKESDGNLLDNLLARMEQYANNLESLVEERTADYLEEKRKCEELLYQLLPKTVAQQLITGKSLIAETFDQVTIYFSDIVGFTALSAESTPLEVVDLLNDLYTCFDSTIENFDVYKVETIGDAYMVVSGLPERNGSNHAREIALMSLELLETVKKFKIRHRPEEPLKLRIGLHTGPCVAGVVGLKMPRYCLFGDTVNTASRMESNGLPLRIHVSPITKAVLDTFGTFDLECRGEIEMKGKGKMTTYWLNGEHEKKASYKSPPMLENKFCKLPSTPIPRNVRKEMASNGRTLNSMIVSDDRSDQADVPLLAITSPPEYHSQV